MYSAEISRKNPGCFIFLLDQSGSMEDPFGGSNDRRKADELATIINKLIHNLSIRCAKGDSIYDYFHVAVIGYGQDSVVRSAFDGSLIGKDLIPISELANNPLRIEDRTKKADDGAGGLVEQTVKFPLWFEARHVGGTPMSSVQDGRGDGPAMGGRAPQGLPAHRHQHHRRRSDRRRPRPGGEGALLDGKR